MVIQIEANTRQWLGLVIVGGIIAGMIFAGLILPTEYQKYIGMIMGAFFYHIVRKLNTPPAYEGPANPTQPPKEG